MTTAARDARAGGLPRENIAGHRQRVEFLLSKLPGRGGRILEFGCGTGVMITIPMCRLGYDVVGLDADAASIVYGRRAAGSVGVDPMRLVCGDISEIPGLFDCVIASEVFEHIPSPDMEHVAESLLERLRPGGLLYVTVPNGRGWFEFESYLWFRAGVGRLLEAARVPGLVHRAKRLILGEYEDAVLLSSLDSSPHVQAFSYRRLCETFATRRCELVEGRGSVLVAGPFSNLAFTGVRSIMEVNLWLGKLLTPLAAGYWAIFRKR